MGRWASSLITVCLVLSCSNASSKGSVDKDGADLLCLGVDACNTALGVLIFAASMNLGNGWMTILSLFGCKLRASDG